MALTKKQLQLPTYTVRLDLAVAAMTGLSRQIVRGMFSNACVTLNGDPVTEPGQPGLEGDTLALVYDAQTRYKPLPPVRHNPQFTIVFEDTHLLVVENQAGLLTVPTVRREKDTLVDHIGRYLSRSDRITKPAALVHRLDRDTSGLLVFGKSARVAEAIKGQFEARKPERLYAALVAGKLESDRGTFESYLVTDSDLDQVSTLQPGQGKLAITHYEIVQRLRTATFVRVQLETGRRNQIRVHFAEAGHPVLGDVRYEVELAKHPHWRERRLALHAQTLGLIHPVTQQHLKFTTELPSCFERFLTQA